jgi:hypothetical protein
MAALAAAIGTLAGRHTELPLSIVLRCKKLRL